MASSSSSRTEKIVLQGSNDITFKVDEAVAKQSVTIKHNIEDSLASRGPILLPKVPGNILAKVIEYCKRVITQPLAGENDVDLKTFVSELVNDNEKTLFELLVATDYLDINGLLSLACEDRKKRCKGRIPGLSTNCPLEHRWQNIRGRWAMAKQSVTIEHLIENMLTRIGLVIIPNCVVTKPPSGVIDVKLKTFVIELVNDDEKTLFGLLVGAYYLDIKGLLSLSCENILDMIKSKDSVHIRRIFNIRSEFLPEEEEERMRSANS
ncbi:hypothetical protein M9H77_24038 [Catharanthus roseus]|uniref:Uncharacterized protein n=1 Tax=Catharanthus roseus TaxID=4058 RepID=A0ACC0AWQ8_CATRO|nr:hypothetical protein M9H77_24038 [Catharanthus roseus]